MTKAGINSIIASAMSLVDSINSLASIFNLISQVMNQIMSIVGMITQIMMIANAIQTAIEVATCGIEALITRIVLPVIATLIINYALPEVIRSWIGISLTFKQLTIDEIVSIALNGFAGLILWIIQKILGIVSLLLFLKEVMRESDFLRNIINNASSVSVFSLILAILTYLTLKELRTTLRNVFKSNGEEIFNTLINGVMNNEDDEKIAKDVENKLHACYVTSSSGNSEGAGSDNTESAVNISEYSLVIATIINIIFTLIITLLTIKYGENLSLKKNSAWIALGITLSSIAGGVVGSIIPKEIFITQKMKMTAYGSIAITIIDLLREFTSSANSAHSAGYLHYITSENDPLKSFVLWELRNYNVFSLIIKLIFGLIKLGITIISSFSRISKESEEARIISIANDILLVLLSMIPLAKNIKANPFSEKELKKVEEEADKIIKNAERKLGNGNQGLNKIKEEIKRKLQKRRVIMILRCFADVALVVSLVRSQDFKSRAKLATMFFLLGTVLDAAEDRALSIGDVLGFFYPAMWVAQLLKS